MNTPIGHSTLGKLLPLIIIIVVLLLFIVFCIKMIIVTTKAKKMQQNKLQQLRNQGVSLYGTYQHIYGLPVPENTFVSIYSYPNNIIFTKDKTEITLEKNKLTDVCITTDVDIQKSYVSSIGGAVGGAVLFGPVGAMIGGRAKAKTSKTIYSYLIFTYKKDNENDFCFIGFDVTNKVFEASRFVDEFKNSPSANIKINL